MTSEPTGGGPAIAEGIRKNLESSHDTIYCTKFVEQILADYVSSPATRRGVADSISLFGCTVESLPGVDRPIVCQKGDVFPLAKDYKNGYTEAESV